MDDDVVERGGSVVRKVRPGNLAEVDRTADRQPDTEDGHREGETERCLEQRPPPLRRNRDGRGKEREHEERERDRGSL